MTTKRPPLLELCRMMKEHTVWELTRKYGVCRHTIWRWCADYGIESIHRGERHHSAKVTEQDVRHIRLLRNDGMKVSELSEKFELSCVSVNKILSGKTWKHVA